MTSNSAIRDETSYLYYAAQMCNEAKPGNDGVQQIAPMLVSLKHDPFCLQKLSRLREELRLKFPELISFGERRASKAYKAKTHSITKPSYILRLRDYDGNGLNQVDNIVNLMQKELCSGGLVFSIYNPTDLQKRYRPGFVPCLVSGSFLVHENELQLNVFFRSQSIIEFGLEDLFFLREFQSETLAQLLDKSILKSELNVGSLNIHFSRVLIQRRLARTKHNYIKRTDLVQPWLNAVEGFMLSEQMR